MLFKAGVYTGMWQLNAQVELSSNSIDSNPWVGIQVNCA